MPELFYVHVHSVLGFILPEMCIPILGDMKWGVAQ